ncbi:hypothetical protein DY000_02054169 [Brassica cretica]|uniref:Secreted protein n=1 Tax=Brassica cretica TaxID=69181 RepID=A0ABQ7AAU7_BRACR|nr:hypothetical protein DY000_02054169 [Brassica cretica]
MYASLTSQHHLGLLELFVVVCEAIVCRLGSVWDVRRLQPLFARSGIVYSLSKLFSDRPLSLRADHRGSQNYWGPDSRLNLAHSFTASCCCGHGRASGIAV